MFSQLNNDKVRTIVWNINTIQSGYNLTNDEFSV